MILLAFALALGHGAALPSKRASSGSNRVLMEQTAVATYSSVCTLKFKQNLRALFMTDTKTQEAKDLSELCGWCTRMGRLGMMLRNDVRTALDWDLALRNSACQYQSGEKKQDCEFLLESFLGSTKPWFNASQDALVNNVELSADQLANAIDSRAVTLCKGIQCCPSGSSPLPRLWTPAPATPIQIRNGLEKDLASFREEKTIVDNMQTLLARRRRQLNMLKSRLSLWRDDLKDQALRLAQEKSAFEKYRTNKTAELTKRESTVKENETKLKNDTKVLATQRAELENRIKKLPKCSEKENGSKDSAAAAA